MTPDRAPATEGAGELRRWIDAHRRFEQSPRLRPPTELVGALDGSRTLRRLLARDVGARLGARLFERIRQGSLGRRQLRNLFAQPLDAERIVVRVLRLLRKRKAAPEGAA